MVYTPRYCKECEKMHFKVLVPPDYKLCILHTRLEGVGDTEERGIAFMFAEQDVQYHTSGAQFLPSLKELAVLELVYGPTKLRQK